MRQELNFLERLHPVTKHTTNTAFHKKIIPRVKHDGSSVMVQGSFAASGSSKKQRKRQKTN